jgi:hypothetical protein
LRWFNIVWSEWSEIRKFRRVSNRANYFKCLREVLAKWKLSGKSIVDRKIDPKYATFAIHKEIFEFRFRSLLKRVGFSRGQRLLFNWADQEFEGWRTQSDQKRSGRSALPSHSLPTRELTFHVSVQVSSRRSEETPNADEIVLHKSVHRTILHKPTLSLRINFSSQSKQYSEILIACQMRSWLSLNRSFLSHCLSWWFLSFH